MKKILLAALLLLSISAIGQERSLDKAWTYRNGGNTDLQIRYLANGNLRVSGLLRISGVNRNIDFMGSGWIRNYPTGAITNLYEFVPDRWFTIDRSIELRLTGLVIKPGQ